MNTMDCDGKALELLVDTNSYTKEKKDSAIKDAKKVVWCSEKI